MMHHFYFKCLVLLFSLVGVGQTVMAAPTDLKKFELSTQVLRINVELENGHYGTGSGVVVAENQVATNCHVVAHASKVHVTSNGVAFAATAIKPDWKHDVCLLTVKNLDASPVKIGSTKALEYGQSVFTIGYPGTDTEATLATGVVKGLYPMDNGVVMRATNPFKVGASGGGAFDDAGNLIGLICLKSPGERPYYYYMDVAWVKDLLDAPALPIHTASQAKAPFWAGKVKQAWPHFMQVVHPYVTHNWKKLARVASEWTKDEPTTDEAWFYLAAAEYALHDLNHAEAHMKKVIQHNDHHTDAVYLMGLIAEERGQHAQAMTHLARLSDLDIRSAEVLEAKLVH